MDSHEAVFCIFDHQPSASAGKQLHKISCCFSPGSKRDSVHLKPHLNVKNSGEDLYVSAHDEGLKDVLESVSCGWCL